MRLKKEDTGDVHVPDPVQFFDTFYDAYQQADRRAHESIERHFQIQGQSIRLRFAGPALLSKLTQALAHLACDPLDNPDLTIFIWDSRSTMSPKPPLPPVGAMPRGDIPGFMNQRILTHIGSDFFSILDKDRGHAVYWCADASQLPLYERGAPLRSILHWWFHTLDIQLVHAGAIGTQTAAVLLAGKGGSGKSTTCLSSLLAPNLLYISDDYSLVGLQPQPFVHTIYNTAKLRPDNLFRLPHMAGKIDNPEQLQTEKALFFLQETFPQKIATRLPLAAILLPQVREQDNTTLQPAAARDSLRALLLSTMHQLAGTDQKTVSIIKNLVSQLPSYHLYLGRDLHQIPHIIESILA